MNHSHSFFTLFLKSKTMDYSKLTVTDYKVIWVVGATERLATLGLFSPNVPLKLSMQTVDLFVEIDKHRNRLFDGDYEVEYIFKTMAKAESSGDIDENELNMMTKLVLEFKNNRTELCRKALSSLVV